MFCLDLRDLLLCVLVPSFLSYFKEIFFVSFRLRFNFFVIILEVLRFYGTLLLVSLSPGRKVKFYAKVYSVILCKTNFIALYRESVLFLMK